MRFSRFASAPKAVSVRYPLGVLFGSLLVLSGCGGEGGTPAPTPAPAPTPTPTPTPTATLTPGPDLTPPSGELKPDAASVTAATAMRLTMPGTTQWAPSPVQQLDGGPTSNRSVGGVSSQLTLVYDPASTDRYKVTNEVRTEVFRNPYFSAAEGAGFPSPIGLRYVIRSESTSGPESRLTLFGRPAAAWDAEHATWGFWQHNEPGTGGLDVRFDYFVYGTPTPTGAMPRAGIVTYEWFGTGNLANDTKLYFTGSSSRMTVDFSTGRITMSLPVSRFGGDYATGNLLGSTFNGQIAGNLADGTLTFSAASWSGTGRVVFYGPNAEKV